MRAVSLEFRKMRRLHTLPIIAVMVVAIVAYSSSSLFTASMRRHMADPAYPVWQGLLLQVAMASALFVPILVAVVASRQVDIENTGAGWNLNATAGLTPGRLCRCKLAALAVLLVPATVLQPLLTALAATMLGVAQPIDPGPWAVFTVLLCLVDLAFCAVHVCLSAWFENQLISMGIGVLGAFLAVFCLLMPPGVARFVPWGYFAQITPVAMTGDPDAPYRYVAPPFGWIAGFLVIVFALFFWFTGRYGRVRQ